MKATDTDRLMRMAEDFAFADGADKIELRHLLAAILHHPIALDIVIEAGWYERLYSGSSSLPRPWCRAIPMAESEIVRKVRERARDLSASALACSDVLPGHIAYAALQIAEEETTDGISTDYSAAARRVGEQIEAWMRPDPAMHNAAVHEAGHTLVMAYGGAMPSEVRIGASPSLLANATIATKDPDLKFVSLKRARRMVCECMAGRAAELVVLGEFTTGCEADVTMARRVGRLIVTVWNVDPPADDMSDLNGPRRRRKRDRVQAWVDWAQKEATRIITTHRDTLDRITEALLKRSLLYRADLVGILGPDWLRPTPDTPDTGAAKTAYV